jgi:hypothetical protein
MKMTLLFWHWLKESFSQFTQGFKEVSIERIERELGEMENAFALLLCASLSGLPAPPPFLGLSLLPYLEREIHLMFEKSILLDDKLAQWADLVEL